jgi:hypothetical protein
MVKESPVSSATRSSEKSDIAIATTSRSREEPPRESALLAEKPNVAPAASEEVIERPKVFFLETDDKANEPVEDAYEFKETPKQGARIERVLESPTSDLPHTPRCLRVFRPTVEDLAEEDGDEDQEERERGE